MERPFKDDLLNRVFNTVFKTLLREFFDTIIRYTASNINICGVE